MSESPAAFVGFHGGVGAVTGSRFLLECGRSRVLLDCGLFQGRELEGRNREAPAFEPSSLDAVVLTHAHLDHSGWLPVLVRRGFRGPVHCTRATAELLEIVLLDAARIAEQDAERAQAKGRSRPADAEPLFDTRDVQRLLRHVEPHAYHESFAAAPDVDVLLRRAGHILGSATVELTLTGGTKLLASGDLGRSDQPILRDPEPPGAADVVLIESTYGDRLHVDGAAERLAEELRAAADRGGAILVPAFAIGRAQVLVWMLHELIAAGRVPALPVYLDSPMALRVSAATCRHREDHDDEMRAATRSGRCPLCAGPVRPIETVQESIELNGLDGPFIVLAGSGMLEGGRILHHLVHRLGDERTTVLLPGFQPAGTRGRQLLAGARSLSLFGRDVPVRAHVVELDGLSAHADARELLEWLARLPRAPRHVYVVHGEPAQSAALAVRVRERFGWTASVPALGERVAL